MNARILMVEPVERRESVRGGAGVAAGLLAILLGLTIALSAVPVRAAAPEFVGILAMVVEDEVARELQLTDEQKSQLLDLIDQREEAAVDLALELRDLGPAEQEARLKPFREESERLGLALLTSEQRRLLERIRIRRLGLAALAEPEVSNRPRWPNYSSSVQGAWPKQTNVRCNGCARKWNAGWPRCSPSTSAPPGNY